MPDDDEASQSNTDRFLAADPVLIPPNATEAEVLRLLREHRPPRPSSRHRRLGRTYPYRQSLFPGQVARWFRLVGCAVWR